MEETFDIKPVGVKYICDVCKEGEMIHNGEMKMFETHVNYVHKCTNCEMEIELNEKYPLIRY